MRSATISSTATPAARTTKTPRSAPRRRRTKLLSTSMQVEAVPQSARRQASCVLEVLAGIRSPDSAAEALEISLPTYYNLETRALRGLVRGCMAESPGRKAALEKQVREAQARCRELEREVQRHRALLRSAQQAAGVLVAEPAASRRSKTSKSSKTSRKARKPRVRALRAIEALAAPDADGRMSTGAEPGASNGQATVT